MKSSQRPEPVRKRREPEESREPEAAERTAEDERDLRDALRAREDAQRKGVYPWEWLKRELEQ